MKIPSRKKLFDYLWKFINSALVIFVLTQVVQNSRRNMDLVTNTQELKVDVENALKLTNQLSIENKNEVKIINQNVTKVEKEIANLRETIEQFYDDSKGEVFVQKDKGIKVKVFELEEISVVYFELQHIPIENSIEITTEYMALSPATYKSFHNIVSMRTRGKASSILESERSFFYIRYHRNFSNEKPLLSLEGMRFEGTDKQPDRATYNIKPIDPFKNKKENSNKAAERNAE